MEKIVTRLKALLAMANDTSSPMEAAIALERARKLIDKYQLENIDDLPVQASEFSYRINGNKQRYWISAMAYAVARLNDCITESAPLPAGGYAYSFFGFPEDAQACRFMIEYLADTGENLYQASKSELGLKGLGDKYDFLIGFASEVCTRINDIIRERKRSIVTNREANAMAVSKATRVKEQYGEQQAVMTENELTNLSAYNGGVDAGKNVHLGHFVGTGVTPVTYLLGDVFLA